jgi:DNA-binding response OmpR family regulator
MPDLDSTSSGVSAQRILLVTPSKERRQTYVVWLAMAGHATTVLSTFKEARSELESRAYALLITDVKLESFNGLQLVIGARVSGAGTRAIVIGDPEPVLEAEAERQGAIYLKNPIERTRFLTTASEMLASQKPTRRSTRKIVPRLEATVDELPARVLDISYEGLRFEVHVDEGSLPTSFTIQVSALPTDLSATRVWVSRQEQPGRERQGGREEPRTRTVQCGAQLTTMDTSTVALWRSLVDSTSNPTTMN